MLSCMLDQHTANLPSPTSTSMKTVLPSQKHAFYELAQNGRLVEHSILHMLWLLLKVTDISDLNHKG